MSRELDRIQEPLQRAGEALGDACRSLGSFVQAFCEFAALLTSSTETMKRFEAIRIVHALNQAPPKVRHLALYSKKRRTREKYINRALREFQEEENDDQRATERV